MENASCLLICGNAALYLALLCQLSVFDGAFPAMLLALGLGLVMLLLAARFRYLPAVRIGLAPLPFLSLLLLPPGLAWISFLPALLIMTLFAALNRFDWDEWVTSRWMRPVLLIGVLLILHFATHDPPVKEGIALCSIFLFFGIVGLRMQRMGEIETGKTLLVAGGVLLPVLIGAAAGLLLWLLLTNREVLVTLLYWLFYPVIWLAKRFIRYQPPEAEPEEILLTPENTPEPATPPPFDPVENSPLVLHLPDFDWSIVVQVLFAAAVLVILAVIFSRSVYTRTEKGRDIEYIPEKKEQKRNKHRPKSTRAVSRVREAYRAYLVMLSVRRGVQLSESDTSLQVQERASELPGQELAEEIRRIYLRARYAGKATSEDAHRIESSVKKLREQLLSDKRT